MNDTGTLRRKKPRTRLGWLPTAGLIVLALAMFTPLYWMIVTSFTDAEHAFALPPEWLPLHVTLDNYFLVFERVPFATQIMNSIIVTVIVVAGQLITSALAAYAFARLRFRGRDALFGVFLVALMVPVQLVVVPIFLTMRTLGLLDTLASLWLPALLSVFGIFFLRQHFLSIPDELEDAAKIDGAGHWRTLFHIFLPLSGPMLAALGIFGALRTWNDFFWPNIMITSPENMTAPVGLVQLQAGLASAPPAAVFAAMSTVAIPLLVLFLFAQRTITQGIALAGVSR